MSHFAKVENGIVTQVLVVEQDFIDTGALGDPSLWIQTSYNTIMGEHLLDGTPLRKNFAGIGYTYDPIDDAFIAPMPDCNHDSLLLNAQKRWECAECEALYETYPL